MNLYVYEGPVKEFDTCVATNWKASTYAVSEKKARSNMAYQYKKTHNLSASSKITLPGKVMLVDEALAG